LGVFLLVVSVMGNLPFAYSQDAEKKPVAVFCNMPGWEYMPFSTWLDGKKPTGFEPELTRLIGEEMGVKMRFVFPVDWTGDPRPAVLSSGVADMVISAYSITKARSEKVDFSVPYFKDGIGVLVAESSTIKTKDDLKGKKLLTPLKTTAHEWALKHVPNKLILVGFPSGFQGKNWSTVFHGHADAVLLDRTHLAWLADRHKGIRVLKERLSEEEFGIAVKKGNKGLLTKINAALQKLIVEGKVKELEKKWIPVPVRNTVQGKPVK